MNTNAKQNDATRELAAAPPNGAAMIDVLAGGCVRRLRLRRGLSRSALGAACGVSGQQVDKYESGANRMSLSRFAQIAEALGTDSISLLAQAHERAETHVPPLPRPAPTGASASQRLKAAELMRLGLDMDEALLDHVLALAKAAAR